MAEDPSVAGPVERSLAEVPDGPIRDRLLASINLLDNYTRGWIAEAIVAELLDASMVGGGYADWDLECDGRRIEVKSAGDIQSWPQTRRSAVRFGIARTSGFIEQPDGGFVADPAKTRRSDAYIFCHHDGVKPDNPAEWEFYVVPTEAIDRVCGDQKTISLSSLRSNLGAEPVKADQLRSAFGQAFS